MGATKPLLTGAVHLGVRAEGGGELALFMGRAADGTASMGIASGRDLQGAYPHFDWRANTARLVEARGCVQATARERMARVLSGRRWGVARSLARLIGGDQASIDIRLGHIPGGIEGTTDPTRPASARLSDGATPLELSGGGVEALTGLLQQRGLRRVATQPGQPNEDNNWTLDTVSHNTHTSHSITVPRGDLAVGPVLSDGMETAPTVPTARVLYAASLLLAAASQPQLHPVVLAA